MPVIETIEPLAWNNSVHELQPLAMPRDGMSLDEIIGQAIDVAETSGFVWHPNALGSLAAQLFEESQTTPMTSNGHRADGIYRQGFAYPRLPAHTLLVDTIAQVFAERTVPNQVTLETLDYPDEGSHMTTHMDTGTMKSPVLIFVIGGIRKANFEVYRMPSFGKYQIPTGPGDIIAQATPFWGRATGLQHGVLRGPRRSLSAIGV